jgi:hypothetical protein
MNWMVDKVQIGKRTSWETCTGALVNNREGADINVITHKIIYDYMVVMEDDV